MSIINEFFKGNVQPMCSTRPRSVAHTEVSDRLSELWDEIKEHCTEEAFIRVQELDQLYSELTDCEIDGAFVNGFRFGALFMIDVLYDENKEINV